MIKTVKSFLPLKAKSYKLKASDGFTLIELLAAIAVIGILSALVLTKVNTGKQNLDRAAQQLALNIRKAQNFALAPSEIPNCIYGLKIRNTSTYFLYSRADCSDGEHYYSPSNGALMIVGTSVTLVNGVTFIATGGFGNGKKDFAFEAPEPITYVENATNTSLTITLTCGAACGAKIITVNRFGMVEIQ